MKIVKDHFHIIIILLSLPLHIPDEITALIQNIAISSSPYIGEVFSFDCLLKYFSIEINSTHFSLVLLIILDIFTVMIYCFYYWKINARTSQGGNSTFDVIKSIFFRIFRYIMLINLVGQIQPFLFQMFCLEVSDPINNGISVSVLITDVRINCDVFYQQNIQKLGC